MKILMLYNKCFDKSKQVRKKVKQFFATEELDTNKKNIKENGGNKQ